MGDYEREWILEPLQEFRFEVEPKNSIMVKIIAGKAELFGTELANEVEYRFRGKKLAIFTWHGCTIRTAGLHVVEYVGHETPMQSHLNLHFALQDLRANAKSLDTVGPRVIIVGPADVGKTTLAKTLAGYAARNSTSTILVDIDPEEGLVSLPGTISAFAVHRPIDVEEEFNASATVYKSTPLCYYYGSTDLQEMPDLYTSLVKQLSQSVETKLKDKQLKHSGIVIDTPSQFVIQNDLDTVCEIIEMFKVNVIIVIGHERLLSDFSRRFPNSEEMKILKLSKSGGVVTRTKQSQRQMHLQRVKEYFYGTLTNDLTPFSQTVSFSDVVVRRVVQGSVAPSSALPIGMEANPHEIKFVKVEVGDILLHSVLAISFAALPGSDGALDEKGNPKIYTPEEETEILLKSNIAGFIYVAEVDDKKRKMTILSPNPGRLPKTYFIMGSLKWMDA